MNGISLFADTNILIYVLSGNERLSDLLNDNEVFILFITELELFGKKNLSTNEKRKIQVIIGQCFPIDINTSIKKRVISLRETYTLKLPDAIIAATAIEYGLPLLTSDKQMEVVRELNSFILEV